MTGSSWGAAAVLLLHLGSLGALPPEVRPEDVSAYAAGGMRISVVIANGVRAAHLHVEGDFHIPEAVKIESEPWVQVERGAGLEISRRQGEVLVKGAGLSLRGSEFTFVPHGDGDGVTMSFGGGWGRRGFYPGGIRITAGPTGLRVVEIVDLETYVAGVVASEMPRHFPLEAMKAQAIAARTYALYHLGAHAADDADLCGSVHCQVYGGQAPPNSTAARAARETAGQVLVYNDLLVDAMYHAACGGSTATAWNVRQGKLLPYLVAESDSAGAAPYCGYDHDISWRRRYSLPEADRLVRANLATVLRKPGVRPGKLVGLQSVVDPGTGRAEWLKVRTANGTYQVKGDSIRWLFGNGRPGPAGLRSTAFELSAKIDAKGRPRAFLFEGRGHGHGLGLCQWGARGRALEGQTAEEILAAYYPGTTVVDLSE